jgi:SAM-dependent methyltransferase
MKEIKEISDLMPEVQSNADALQCTMDESGCCIVASNDTERAFWDDKWAAGATGWDLGTVAPELKNFFDSIENKSSSILIPGCGNAHEAGYLLSQGFTNITVIDIAPTLTRNLRKKHEGNPNIQILDGDFFELKGSYDYIIEQTFFCAIPPTMRVQYVKKMNELLNEKGVLAGLLFNRDFEGGPPFSGSIQEYQELFPANGLEIVKMEVAMNSIPARQGTEVFFTASKKKLNCCS